MLRMPALIRDLLADRSANAVVVTAFSILSLIGEPAWRPIRSSGPWPNASCSG
jgi:hypothetical protein